MDPGKTQQEEPVGRGPGEGLVAGEGACLSVPDQRGCWGLLTSPALFHLSPPPLPGALHRPEARTKAVAVRCGLDAGQRCAHALVLCTVRFFPFRTGEEVKAGETGGETTPFPLLLNLSTLPTPSEPLIPGWRGGGRGGGGDAGGPSPLLQTVPAPPKRSPRAPFAPSRSHPPRVPQSQTRRPPPEHPSAGVHSPVHLPGRRFQLPSGCCCRRRCSWRTLPASLRQSPGVQG